MQKEENDTLITDNKKLPQKKVIDRFDKSVLATFWGLQAGVLAPGPQLTKKEKYEKMHFLHHNTGNFSTKS